jgi:uncharacterized protein (DUF58 family)
MIRPTRRAVLAFAVGVPLALLLVSYDAALWPLSFDCGVLVLIVIGTDALLVFPKRRLRVAVATPERLYIGEHGHAAVTLAGARPQRATRFELCLEQRGDLDRAGIVTATLPPGGETRVDLPVVPRLRGRVRIDRLWLRWRGPLGLVQVTTTVPLDRTIDVLPNVRGVQGAALQFFTQEAIYGVKVQRQRGEGTEYDALRDYAPGLDSRFIDWKHSARHNKLLCKEFKTERNHEVILAFDTGYLMREPVAGLSRLDHAINAGLLLAWISLQGGDLVGTFGFDASVRQFLRPIRGIGSFSRIQQATAELAYRSEETNYTLGLAELSARLKRRALVILFTDFVDTVTAELLIESMQRIAARHAVIFVGLRDEFLQSVADAAPGSIDAVAQAVVAFDFLRDRSIVFERLDRLGIHCLDATTRGLPAGLINRYLMIKQRGLI